MKSLAIIPARSGSKGLPNKNIRVLNGKPLMAWSIEAALGSNCFTEIMVSTDSREYAVVAREYGASVPFLRSDLNSSDSASTWDAVREVVEKYEENGMNFDTICVLQPTSPLRSHIDIIEAFAVYKEKRAKSIVSVCKVEHPIEMCNTLDTMLSLDGFFDSNVSGRRQDCKPYYRLNGAIYIQNKVGLMNKDNLYGSESYAYVMDKYSSIDIDDEIDFAEAEAIMKLLFKTN